MQFSRPIDPLSFTPATVQMVCASIIYFDFSVAAVNSQRSEVEITYIALPASSNCSLRLSNEITDLLGQKYQGPLSVSDFSTETLGTATFYLPEQRALVAYLPTR